MDEGLDKEGTGDTMSGLGISHDHGEWRNRLGGW